MITLPVYLLGITELLTPVDKPERILQKCLQLSLLLLKSLKCFTSIRPRQLKRHGSAGYHHHVCLLMYGQNAASRKYTVRDNLPAAFYKVSLPIVLIDFRCH